MLANKRKTSVNNGLPPKNKLNIKYIISFGELSSKCVALILLNISFKKRSEEKKKKIEIDFKNFILLFYFI